VAKNNGQPDEGKEAPPKDSNESIGIPDDWLYLVPTADEIGPLARCTPDGLEVDTWSKPRIGYGLKHKKVIAIFKTPDTPEQREALAMLQKAEPVVLRVWRPAFLGDEAHPDLRELDEDFHLGKVVALEKPWLPRSKSFEEIDRAGKLTIGLDEIECREVAWLYENRLAPGFITLFAGRSGLGKSFVTCDIVARFSRGEPAYRSDILIDPPIRTLFISEDSPEVVLGPRLNELQAVKSMVRFMTWDAMASFTLDNTDFLNRAYQECGRPGLLVIDPPANFLGATDEHKNAEVRGVLKGLIAWLEAHGVAAILITHINKQIGKGMDAVERIMGSVAWGTTARITCAFAKDPDSRGQCLFGGTKNNLGEIAEPLIYKIKKTDKLATVEWLGKSETTMDDAIDRITKKTAGKVAAEWVEQRFTERREWESSELKTLGRDAGIAANALFKSPEVAGLPIIKRQRTTCDGRTFWMWTAEDGWPSERSERSESEVKPF
jgi:hypothetical protein